MTIGADENVPPPARPIAAQPHVCRMDDDRGDIVVAVEVEAEQQHRSLGGDQHLDLFGQLESVGCLPVDRGHEARDEHLHAIEFGLAEKGPVLKTRDEFRPPRFIELER